MASNGTTTEPRPANCPLAGVRVVLVNGYEDERQMYSILLEREGATVAALATVDEALDWLQLQEADVLMSDVRIAEKDGYELMCELRSRPASCGGRIAALALAAWPPEFDRGRAFACGYQA